MEKSHLTTLVETLIGNTSQHVFLTGNAGTGKTTLLRHIMAHTHKNYVVVAPTGIAALNAGGTTIHSFFQLPFGAFIPIKQPLDYAQMETVRIHDRNALIKHLQMNNNKRKLFRELELLIIDEVSMLRSDMLDAMDFMLRVIRKKMALPFGGVQVLFIGDMLQLPPVVKDQEWHILQQYYSSAYFFDAQVMQQVAYNYVELDKIYRQDDVKFIQLLNNLRYNELNESDAELLAAYYRPEFKPKKDEGFITLTTHNAKADKINHEQLVSLDTPTFQYTVHVEGEFPEYLYPLDPILSLKLGAQVMFIKNDPSIDKQYYNGKIGIVSEIDNDKIIVTCPDDSVIEVTPYTWENQRFTLNEDTQEIEPKTIGTFTLYPIKLAWAITVHKSQGLTFERAIVDLQGAFSPGQIYVALSRLTGLQGLVLSSHFNPTQFRTDQQILTFSERKLSAHQISEKLEQEQYIHFLHEVKIAFNFHTLIDSWAIHLQTYGKLENKSVRQKNQEWAQNIFTLIEPLRKYGDTFIQQITHLINNKEADRSKLLEERIHKAMTYFLPVLQAQSLSILNILVELTFSQNTKSYIEELKDLEILFYNHYKKIVRTYYLIKSISAKETLDKNAIPTEEYDTERMKNLVEIISHKKKKKRQKEDVPTESTKKKKGNSQHETYLLWKQGMKIEEICTERGFTKNTIEGHLAEYVAKGEIATEEIVAIEKIEPIQTALKKHPDSLLEVKKILGDDYTYGEIKIVKAALQFEESKTLL